MTPVTGDRDEQVPPPAPPLSFRDAEIVKMPKCARCKLSYLPAKSTSALRLTYCSFLCELGDLGFSMAGLEHMQRAARPAAEPEPVAAE